jgi:gamma-glutamyltranspeptidase/glutathione hydrolase
MQPHRPSLMATRHLVVSGHYLASQAGFQILEAGGNAIDAGVAVGLAINVLESEMTGFGGVAPAMIRLGHSGEICNFIGVGPWPRALDASYFHQHHGGQVPPGILDCVVPATPAIWLSALQRFGTLSFAEVASFAIDFANKGFPVYPLMPEALGAHLEEFRHWPSTAAIFCPNGELLRPGDCFRQSDLGATLTYLCDEERAASASGGRDAGLEAARLAFYEGDIAAAIIRQQEQQGGLITREDLAAFRAQTEAPTKARFGEYELYGCGPWSQGPMVLSAAQILENFDLAGMGHNSTAYIHTVVEALKLAAADREAYFGDPAHVDVPMDTLLDADYCRVRSALIDTRRAQPGMPAPGPVDGFSVPPWQPDPTSMTAPEPSPGRTMPRAAPLETSYFCVMDADGNLFSATPSDPTTSGAVVPGTGITTSRWGSRAHTDENHPARVGPGWRPRMSANPMLAMKPGEVVLPLGSPGSEVLGQAQLQVLLNIIAFDMNPQTAVEAPRFASESWPASAIPHTYHPGRLKVEKPIGAQTGDELSRVGHEVKWWPEREWRAGSVCTIRADLGTGLMHAGADPRRTAYAVGW